MRDSLPDQACNLKVELLFYFPFSIRVNSRIGSGAHDKEVIRDGGRSKEWPCPTAVYTVG